jgi:hypothetical protein
MKPGRIPKPLPVHVWIEPIDDDTVALNARCVVTRHRPGSNLTSVWAAGAFAICERRGRSRGPTRDDVEAWGLAAIAAVCGRPADQPCTRWNQLHPYAILDDLGNWKLRRPLASPARTPFTEDYAIEHDGAADQDDSRDVEQDESREADAEDEDLVDGE